MPQFVWDVVINAKPDDVWAFVGDLNRHGEWSPKPYRVEWLSGEPNSVGSRFRSVGWLPGKPETAMEGEVTENQPTSRFAVRSSAPNTGEFTNAFVLEQTAEGTTVVKRIQDAPMPTGFLKVIMPVLFPLLIRPGIQKGMNLLKVKVEAAR